MKPNPIFLKQPKSFWACVRSLSQKCGYSRDGILIVPDIQLMADAFVALDLNPENIQTRKGATELGKTLESYFNYRSDILHKEVEPNLMDLVRARALFDKLKRKHNPSRPFPMNKQKGEKRAEAYLTGMVNMIVEAEAAGFPCDFDPRQLTTITHDGRPVRTLARRVDGAFPNIVNPIAIWEIKEYYYTTTFGSRVADGVYETLLDGLELEELREHEGVDVKHYLMVDAYKTWWEDGKSYLCRMVDMLHMGYVDEILFGEEVANELPRIVREWVASARAAGKDASSDAELM